VFHRHLLRERYELALESGPAEAAALQAQHSNCPKCMAALTETSLRPRLEAWSLGPEVELPLDWRAAHRRATAPSQQARDRQARPSWLRGGLVLAAAALIVVALAPAAAAAGPDSILYPVRGFEENLSYTATAAPARPKLEADYASSYLWEARLSADHHDRAAYQASMERFQLWAERLKTDVHAAAVVDRPAIRETVTSVKSLAPTLATSPTDDGQANQAIQTIQAIERNEEGEQQHQEND
jgi:hypothetical protein